MDVSIVTDSLTNLPNTLIKLKLHGMGRNESLSFLTNFTNLQVLVLSNFKVEGSQALHHVDFTRLKVLKFKREPPYHADLMKFLERNGRNLELLRFHGDDDANDDYFNLNLMNFCPNLKTLRTRSEGDVGGLMNILKGFQQLESLENMNPLPSKSNCWRWL